MRTYLLYRVRTFDGATEVRGEFTKELSEVVSFVLKHHKEQTPGAWLSVDVTYPDDSVKEEATYWSVADGFRGNPEGEIYRPRCGGGRGLDFTGSWVVEERAEAQWLQAAEEYDGVPVAWAVVDKLLPDGSIEIHRRWTASPEAVITAPAKGRQRLPRIR